MTMIIISLCGGFFITFPIYIISSVFASTKRNSEKALDLAISKGHVVTAYKVKQTRAYKDMPGLSQGTGYGGLGIYKYEWNGKKYKKRCPFSGHNAPSTITLYFLKNPRKAVGLSELSNSNKPWLLIYVFGAIFTYLLINIAKI